MAIAIALPRFNDLGRLVAPFSFCRNRFHFQLSPHCPKMNKKLMWEVKTQFKISFHRTLNLAIMQLQGV